MDAERVDVLQLRGKQRVLRWRSGTAGAHGEEFVSLGWLPDGRWWVEDTRHRLGWVWRAETSAAARDLAQACSDGLMRGGDWRPTIAVYEPGVLPERAAEVSEWPPGHGPDRAGTET